MNNQSNNKKLIPYAVLCELTHRCPLSCPYCSNPVNLETKSNEIDTSTWKRVILGFSVVSSGNGLNFKNILSSFKVE